MIYKVNGYNTNSIYFDEINNPNAKADAEALLAQKQADVLAYEAVRFSVCATFVNGNDTTWREIQDSDPEDTICQVFDHINGSYTQVNSKKEANALNEKRKQEFLVSLKLDKVEELTEMPTISNLPNLEQQFGTVVGSIPVEVM